MSLIEQLARQRAGKFAGFCRTCGTVVDHVADDCAHARAASWHELTGRERWRVRYAMIKGRSR